MKRASWKVFLMAVFAVSLFESVASQTSSTLPSITHHSGGRVVRPGESVTLYCVASSGVHQVQWYKEDRLVEQGPVYTISSFNQSFEGDYYCRATLNTEGTITSAVVQLQLATLSANPPGEINNPQIRAVALNSPAILDCGAVDSTPPVVYDWITLRDFHTQQGIIKGIDGRLYFQWVTQQIINYGWIFNCRVTNSYVSDFREGFIQLAVNTSSSPSTNSQELLSWPKDTVVNVGDNVDFQCIVGGSSPGEITWSTPTATSAMPTNNMFISTNGAEVNILSATIDNAGVYSCNVTGLGVFSASLTVLVPPIMSTNLSTLYSPTFGDPLTMTCGSTNTQISEWVWFHNGVRLPLETTNTLTIDSAHVDDDGFYQCFAYNSAGNASSMTRVSVQVEQAVLRSPPLPAPRLLFEGDGITYTCMAYGAPPPTIQWRRDGALIDSDMTQTTTSGGGREVNSVLTLSSLRVENSGNYQCRAVNVVNGKEVGRDESETELRVVVPSVITKPSQDETLRILEEKTQDSIPCLATAQDGVTLSFTWFKDGAPLVYNASRLYLVKDNHAHRSANITYSPVMKEDAGVYQCRVVSYYNDIEGPVLDSSFLTVETTPIPEIPPKIREPENITSTSFKITWYYPGQRALDKLDSYTVSYKEKGASEPIKTMEVEVNGDNSAIIGAPEYTVKPYTTYNVTVSANYKLGSVRVESVLVTTSQDRPGPPTNVTGVIVNTTTVLIEWKNPIEPNGIITNYTIRYKKDADSSSTYETVSLVKNSTYRYLTGLDRSSAYLVSVAASTEVGLGPYSDSITLPAHTSVGELSRSKFYNEQWFIAIMLITLLVLVCGLIFFLAAFTVCCKHRSKKKKYSVTGMELNQRNGTPRSLTEDDMKDYNGRGSRMNGESSIVGLLDGRESESSKTSTRYPYEASISTMSHISSQAPAYINPPPFHEAIKSLRPTQISPAYSGSTLDQPSTVYTIETDSSFWPDTNSRTRILNVDQSPSPARSYQHSPYTPTPPIPAVHRLDTTPQPPPPPPPPPPPSLPKSPEHKYASVEQHTTFDQSAGGDGKGYYPNSPGPGNDDENGYNRLPVRPSSQQQQRVRLTSTPQCGTVTPPHPPPLSSPVNHRTASSSSPPLHTTSSSPPLQLHQRATIGSTTPRNVASSFQLQSGSSTISAGHSNPMHLRSSVQNMRINSTSPGMSQHARTNSQPLLAKTSSQPNFATFV